MGCWSSFWIGLGVGASGAVALGLLVMLLGVTAWRRGT